MIPLLSKDQEYFDSYPAPIMKMLQEKHFTIINATIPFFAPMIYFLIRAFKCEKVLEIGHAEGYTAWYMANAVKDNAIRHQLRNPMYFGIDIIKSDDIKKILTDADLPNTIINLDTINLTEETFKDIQFDLIFQDGAHDTEHVMHEFKILWPQLRGNGLGYFLMHDVMGPTHEAFKQLIPTLGKDAEWVRLDDDMWGMTILRNMKGYDYNADRIYGKW